MKADQTVTNTKSSPQPRDQEIDRRYGAIGISAVAAAVRCQNLDQQSAPPRERDERSERTVWAA